MFKKILLPVDQPEYNEKTLAVVKDLAIKNGSEVVIFNAQDNSGTIYWGGHPIIANIAPGSSGEYSDDIEKKPSRFFENAPIVDDAQAKSIVEKVSRYFEGNDIKVIKRTSIGDPPAEILKQLELDPDIDVIIMSTHGMSITRRFLLGSVTNKIVHHSKVPVLVMR